MPSVDLRISRFREALLAMRKGRFDAAVPSGNEDAIGLLGEDINRLSGELGRRFAELGRLQEISEQVEAGLFLDDVLDRVYESFRSVIPYDRIGCALLDREQKVVTARWLKTSYGAPAIVRGFSQPIAGSSLAGILASGKPRILNDLEEYLRSHPDSVSTQVIVKEGIRSSLTCPLVAQGHPVGFLFFSSRKTDTYRDAHEELFMRIAGQLSIVMEKSVLYEEVHRVNRELLVARARLEHQATHDALTGLPNRRAFIERVERELQSHGAGGQSFGLLMLDIDHFKHVNDSYGHLAGDEVLRQVAQALLAACRPGDALARYGGEEFVICIPVASESLLAQLAERLRTAVARLSIAWQGQAIPLTVSLGGALVGAGVAATADELVSAADAGLYEAKRTGRNRYASHPVTQPAGPPGPA